jgi:hypothetical protein
MVSGVTAAWSRWFYSIMKNDTREKGHVFACKQATHDLFLCIYNVQNSWKSINNDIR